MPVVVIKDEAAYERELDKIKSGDLLIFLFYNSFQKKSKDGASFGDAELAQLAEKRSDARIFSINAGEEFGEDTACNLGVKTFPALQAYFGKPYNDPVLRFEGQDCYECGVIGRLAGVKQQLQQSEGMVQDTDLRDAVRGAYAQTVTGGASVLPGDAGDPQKRSQLLGYNQDEVNASADLGLGCGNPLVTANLQPGEIVLDLGSGAGMDCFIAAKEVGPTGKIIGVDMTPEMISKARATAKKDGVTNVTFRLGEIEHLPVGDAVINCLISNCVINLSTEKAQVYKEMNRVLVPGGRVSISDVLRMSDIPKELQTMQSYACCVSGASDEDEMLEMLKGAGFSDIKIQIKENAADIISGWMPGSGAEKYVTSAYVTATKPVGGIAIRDDVYRVQTVAAVAMEVDPAAAPAAGCCG